MDNLNKKTICLCFIIHVCAANAAPEVNEEYAYYLIYPDSPSAIASELARHSPIRENGKIFRGHTQWHVVWNYRWESRDNFCKLNHVDTRVNIIYTMPKLAESHRQKAIETRFNAYYTALMNHEHGHKESGIEAAIEIEETLLSIPEKTNCQELEAVANNKAKNIIRKYNKKDIVYDYKTDHGRTQGAYID